MSYGFSPKLPLTYNEEDGPYRLLKTIKDVGQQNLKMLVLTNPGERVMDPRFGVGVSRYLFEQEGSFIKGDLEREILRQVDLYIPYINITNINIITESDLNRVRLEITYFIESFTREEILYIDVENNS
jgi:phage baseplate assembly protein W